VKTKAQLLEALQRERDMRADLVAACELALQPMPSPWIVGEAEKRRAVLRAAIAKAKEMTQ